ncbi:MAG: hypothetical protein WBB25_04380, partial [Sulfitobacter sp.]
MIRWPSILLLACVIALATILLYDPKQKLPTSEAFEPVEDFTIYNVFDAGIADLNGDGETDRWTVNHSAAQWVRFGGDGQAKSDVENDIAMSGLYQDSNLPGLEAGLGSVRALRPIRIYMQETHFVVEADGLTPGDRVKG